jgi:hypothetical protein
MSLWPRNSLTVMRSTPDITRCEAKVGVLAYTLTEECNLSIQRYNGYNLLCLLVNCRLNQK